MIAMYMLWGLGVSAFAFILSVIVDMGHRKVRNRKKDLRELPKLFSLDKEDEK
jgi:hypothetical protein